MLAYSGKGRVKVEPISLNELVNEMIQLLNRIRRENLALQQYANLTFHRSENPQVLFYRKASWVRPRQWTGGKQQLTATRLHELLRGEGHHVGVTLVKEAVAEWKRQRREVFVPLTYRPGDLAEVDFFEVFVDVAGRRQKAWLFLMRLMYSGRDFGWIYERQDQVSFLDGHVRAFAHFNGVSARVAYDNLKPAVVRILVGGERALTPRFAALASHYLFEPCFCRPGEGHDKGGVEARGKALRR